jgi:hypothetical protein
MYFFFVRLVLFFVVFCPFLLFWGVDSPLSIMLASSRWSYIWLLKEAGAA